MFSIWFPQKVKLYSNMPKKEQNCITYVVSPPYSREIDRITEAKKKPEITTFYNTIKAGVDVQDEMSTSYDVSRNSKRWSNNFFALFICFLINSLALFRANNPQTWITKRQFLKDLGNQLSRKGEIQKIWEETSKLPGDSTSVQN